jgi:thymidylate kinase
MPTIAFLGPDGAGKSTLTEPLAHLRWPRVRRQFMGPARPSEMRRTFHWTMCQWDRLRQKYTKKHPLGIVSRAAWQLVCYLDFWDRLIRHRSFCRQGGVLVCDRYACDMYFRKPTMWNEFVFLRLFPRPRFVFLCVGDPHAIHQRKPELSSGQIQETIERYRAKLTRYRIPCAEIDTARLSPDEALRQAVQHAIDNGWFRAGREGKVLETGAIPDSATQGMHRAS